jgi:hypothetical protein
MELLRPSKPNATLNLLRGRFTQPIAILLCRLLQIFIRFVSVYQHPVWLQLEDVKN